MAGLPKIQNAQYGDSAKLEQLGSSRMTNNPAAGVQDFKNMEGGRPKETDPVKLAIRSMGKPQQQGQLSPEQQKYQGLFNSLRVQHAAVQKWITLASSPAAGPFTKSYAMAAVKSYQQAVMRVRSQTPFFNED